MKSWALGTLLAIVLNHTVQWSSHQPQLARLAQTERCCECKPVSGAGIRQDTSRSRDPLGSLSVSPGLSFPSLSLRSSQQLHWGLGFLAELRNPRPAPPFGQGQPELSFTETDSVVLSLGSWSLADHRVLRGQQRLGKLPHGARNLAPAWTPDQRRLPYTARRPRNELRALNSRVEAAAPA